MEATEREKMGPQRFTNHSVTHPSRISTNMFLTFTKYHNDIDDYILTVVMFSSQD